MMVPGKFLMAVPVAMLASTLFFLVTGAPAFASMPAFVSSIDGHVYRIDTSSGNVTGAVNASSYLAGGPDGRLYVADYRRACIAIFDAGSGARLGTMEPGTPFDDYISIGDACLIAVDTSTYAVSPLVITAGSGLTRNETGLGAPVANYRVVVPPAASAQITATPTPNSASPTPSSAAAGAYGIPFTIAGLLIFVAIMRRKP